jgi:hypothetical protein
MGHRTAVDDTELHGVVDSFDEAMDTGELVRRQNARV